MGAIADFAGFIESLHREGNDLAVHSGDLRFCPDFQSHRSCAGVLDIQLDTHSGFIFAQSLFDCLAGGTFHQRYHAGGGIDQQGTGAHFLGRILPFYQRRNFCFHSNSDFHSQTLPF